MNLMKTLLVPLSLFAIFTANTANAADAPLPPPPPPHGGMKGPPPFDPALCRDKAAGASVETKTPDGRSIKGKCVLVFLPEPPPQAPAETRQ